MAANGAGVIAIDIAGPVSTATKPATPEKLNETVRLINNLGRRSEAIQACANAAIQIWKRLLEIDVIDNNLNGAANTIRAFVPKMVARQEMFGSQ